MDCLTSGGQGTASLCRQTTNTQRWRTVSDGSFSLTWREESQSGCGKVRSKVWNICHVKIISSDFRPLFIQKRSQNMHYLQSECGKVRKVWNILHVKREKWERNVLFNDALNTFYLRLYGVRYMVKDHSDSEKGNPLPPHRLFLSINSKGSFICTIPQTG